jgi:hypothetical protein
VSIALPRVAAVSAALLSAIACNDGDGARTRSAGSDAAEPATSDDAGFASSDGATSGGLDAGPEDASARDVSVEPARDASGASAPDAMAGSVPTDASTADAAAPSTFADAATTDASNAVAPTDASSTASDGSSNDGAVTARVCSGDRWAMDVASAAAVGECGSITGNLAVAGALTELVLPRLTSIGGYVTIFATPALLRIELPALTRIGGFLDISGNEALRSVALPALRTVNDRAMTAARDVAIRENPQLPGCQAEQLRTQLMNAGFNGSIDVSSNGPVCRP